MIRRNFLRAPPLDNLSRSSADAPVWRPTPPTMKLHATAACAALLCIAPSGPAADPPNSTLLFQNLRKLSNAFGVDDRSVANTVWKPEGPKGLATADLDRDGLNDLIAANQDGTIAVLFGKGAADFEAARHLTAGDPRGLRDVIAADTTSDGRPEIIAAHPFAGKLYIFSLTGGAGSRSFLAAQTVDTWPGARAVIAGDFNGDGHLDLLVAGAGNGVREYRNDGGGNFTALPSIANIPAPPFAGSSATPVFATHTWRHAGELRDRAVVTFAGASHLWFLESASGGDPLSVASALPVAIGESVYDLTMGYVSAESRVSGEPDLLTAVQWSGEVFIRRYVPPAPGASAYYTTNPQRLAVPGGPRAISVADVNGDTWPDVLVAARIGNTLSLFLNTQGVLSLASQTPAGSSPREVVTADFDGNGLPDAAVINRKSEDVTVHRIDPETGWFYQSPLVQRILGGATAPKVTDLDGDGGPEAIYLVPTRGELVIRKFTVASGWARPVRYSMGARPQTLDAVDMNGDGRLDLQTTSLGEGAISGGLHYRLQSSDHTFGPLITVPVSEGLGGAMFAQVWGDFDGDGVLDFIAGFYDCRIAFFQGTAAGLVHRRTEQFVYEARPLVALDADQDGDLDLVGAGVYGDLAVVENDGKWFTGGAFRKTLQGDKPVPGAHKIFVDDKNGDGDPDLVVLARAGASRWNGGPGLTFEFVGTAELPPTWDAYSTDYDGDGILDQFALCPVNTTASFFRGRVDADWWTERYVPYAVPAVDSLTSGDFDGDGRPDLMGAGEHLWIALSGTPAPPAVPTPFTRTLPEVQQLVINELLANPAEYVPKGATVPVDCVEIFNGTGLPANLAGCKLRIIKPPGEASEPDFTFPAVTLPPGEFAIVYCTSEPGLWSADFKLPANGGTVQLLTATGEASDLMTYPAQEPDVSYARLFDGSRNFVFNPFPSIGSANYDNGNSQPKVAFKGVDVELLKTGKWRFRARGWDPDGMFTLLIYWREMTAMPKIRGGMIPLYDDGMHDDARSLDGVFAGDWLEPLPAGTPIEFYIQGMDLRFESSTEPQGPAFTAVGQPMENYTLALPATRSGWEISEVVPRNQTGLKDEQGRTPDWTELRYTGTGSGPVQNLFLSDSLFGFSTAKLYDLSRIAPTAFPGLSKVVFLSDTRFDPAKPRHAPFGANGEDGDSLFLLRLLPSGATELVDAVKVPSLPPDKAFARAGAGGPFVLTDPTPDAPNAPRGGALHMVPGANGAKDALFAFPGAGRVEASDDLNTWTTVLPTVPESSIEHTHRERIQTPHRFYRVR